VTPAVSTHAFHFDFAVYIGRFQPFHIGHLRAVEQALTQAKRLIILVGSHETARSPKNPWTTEERSRMVRSSIGAQYQNRVTICGIHDIPYNDQLWFAQVQTTVDQIMADDGATQPRITLLGHDKDESSYYLRKFPQWQFTPVEPVKILNATDVREAYFTGGASALAAEELPAGTREFIASFEITPFYTELKHEAAFVAQYKAQWAVAPYPPTFVTVDTVVIEAGYLLLVKRKFAPGKGLWALPGGFANPGEWLLDAALRELREETRLKVPLPVLRGSVKANRVFDWPARSSRGRTITHAYLIELEHNQWTGLHEVKGTDDAERAQWVRLSDFYRMRTQMFEDHFDIASTLLASAAPAGQL
jgi:bifunctional NMN adenylyltransferase/nudix hydrolase